MTCKAAKAFLPNTLQQIMKKGHGNGKAARTIVRHGFGGGRYNYFFYDGPEEQVVSQIPYALTALVSNEDLSPRQQ